MTESRREYLANYKREKVKRVPLDVPPEMYDVIKRTAEENGESVNGYLKRVIRADLVKSVMKKSKNPVSKS